LDETEATEKDAGSENFSEDYKIALDIYSGPLDLLLYLVYKSELDIFNIPIANILDQYLSYVEMIKTMDIEIAGDFMVMASRLMNIKSKMLMPRPKAEAEDEEIMDPRAELVKELLEYKEFKEKAYALEIARSERKEMFERIPPKEKKDQEPVQELFDENVNIWDLLMAFHKVTKDFMPDMPRKIVYDDTPVSVYVDRLLDIIVNTPGKRLPFSTVFEREQERVIIIGMFLAVLEAAKRGALKVEQVQDGGDIFLAFVPEEERIKPEEPSPGAPAETEEVIEAPVADAAEEPEEETPFPEEDEEEDFMEEEE